MPFTVTQRKRGGFEYTSVAETEGAALVLAQMMRRAGDEYCGEAMVTVRSGAGVVVAAWRGSTYGWQPVPQSRPPVPEVGLHPLSTLSRPSAPTQAAPAQRRASSPFARQPTEPMQHSQVSRGSFASISITDYSAVSVA
jgi:hypothetical protein